MGTPFLLLIAGVLSLFIISVRTYAGTLDVSLMIATAEQRSVFAELGHRFEQSHPGVTVRWIADADSEYKQNLSGWLASADGPDVLYWQAGERLQQIARTGQIAPITGIWNADHLATVVPKEVRQSVTYNNKLYALPYSYYQWGFYYRRSLFRKLDLQPPQTWQQLLAVCGELKFRGIKPIAIGSRNFWPTAAWFDYIDLRLNGLAFHQSVVSGDVSFLNPRIRAIFTHWKTLLDRDCFTPSDQQVANAWREILPMLYHNKAGMTLMGNFLTAQLPDRMRADFGFFPFPKLKNDVGRFEEAPTDVFMLATRSADNKVARAFLRFLGDAKNQSVLNNRTGKISVNATAPIANDYFLRQGATLLGGADGLTQFFDRDAPKALADPAMRAFRDFMANRDIDKTLERLEAIRQSL